MLFFQGTMNVTSTDDPQHRVAHWLESIIGSFGGLDGFELGHVNGLPRSRPQLNFIASPTNDGRAAFGA